MPSPAHTPSRATRSAHRASARSFLVLLTVLVAVVAAPGARGGFPPGSIEVDTPVLPVLEPVEQPAERWVYGFSWGPFVKVGEVEITTGERVEPDRSRSIAISIRGGTGAIVDWFWRYRVNADGVVRLDPFRPGRFEVRESIKRDPKTTWVEFDGNGGVHTYRNKKGRVREHTFATSNAYDLPSMIYLLLNQDLAVGKRYEVDTLAGNTRYIFTVEVVEEETIRLADANRPAFKLEVSSQDLTDPPDTEKHSYTHMWVSAERPRRLLQATSNLWFGTARFRLLRIEEAIGWPQPPPEIDLGLKDEWLTEQARNERPAPNSH